MTEQLLSGIVAVWSVSAVIASVLGGLAVGAVIDFVSPRSHGTSLAKLILLLGTMATAVFWTGQVLDAVLTADPSWGRAFGRALLGELFVVASAAGAYIAAMSRKIGS